MKRFKGEQASGDAEPSEPSAKVPKVSSDGMFREYDLRELGVPQKAWPQQFRVNNGAHGYTVVAFNSAVLCRDSTVLTICDVFVVLKCEKVHIIWNVHDMVHQI